VRLVEILVVGDDRDALAPHVAFQFHGGVDAVVAGVDADDAESLAVLEPHVPSGRVQAVGRPAGAAEDALRDELARVAVREHGADWILDARADELWWPRGSTLKDPLEAMPPRYGIVQGLVRLFVPAAGDGPFWERMTERLSLEPPAEPEPLEWALRPLYRADQRLRSDHGGRVPLRAWYPFEVLTFPLRDAEQATRALARRPSRSTLDEEARQVQSPTDSFAAVGRGRLLVVDTRARDVLGALAGPGGTFDASGAAAPFRSPDLVDDASFAVECAAVGEVDLPRLERYVSELEGRVAWLEQRLWPRLVRRVARLVRR
jgi:hypothetical protein